MNHKEETMRVNGRKILAFRNKILGKYKKIKKSMKTLEVSNERVNVLIIPTYIFNK